ncbi:MAG: alanine racemase [Acidobacteriota bacterium]
MTDDTDLTFPAALQSIPTPALLVSRRVLMRNLDAMQSRARRLGVDLRPHVKTHKCVEIARLQAGGGARGLTVSTLAEARAFAAAGFDDLTLAVPLAAGKIRPALALARGLTLRLLLDDDGTLDALERRAAAAGFRPHVWLKIDCGYHRAGLDPDGPAAWALARRLAASPHVVFDGLLTHAGHAYDAPGLQRRRQIAAGERDAVTGLAGRLRAAGVPVPGVSVGSTPTLTAADDLSGVTEVRPGNYVFFDLTQVALQSCELADIAVSVLATVISHPPGGGRIVIDAGALALSKDAGRQRDPSAFSMGAVCPDVASSRPDPSLRLTSLSQEHGIIQAAGPDDLDDRLPVGARVRILPQHSCLATACHDRALVIEDGRITGAWTIHRRR